MLSMETSVARHSRSIVDNSMGHVNVYGYIDPASGVVDARSMRYGK